MAINQLQLLEMAGVIAREQGAPVNTIVKELLHYEILYALGQSGVAEHLVFQGGTALRLCYGGLRYSEDLDFASGYAIPELPMAAFTELLTHKIGETYGLEVKVQAHRGDLDRKVTVDRWKATIKVPNPNPSIPQSQFITIDIASVPAYERDYRAVAQNYTGLPLHLRQMLIAVESQNEIMADKIVALGARTYIKARDIWDIKFLQDKGIKVDTTLVSKKLDDYGLDAEGFKQSLNARIATLGTPETAKAFEQEMSRFVTAATARLVKNPDFIRLYMDCSAQVAAGYLEASTTQPLH
jgi:predicted nucleotidyltransferase component of viral defense system